MIALDARSTGLTAKVFRNTLIAPVVLVYTTIKKPA
jgi:hypothetical protein